MSQEFFPLSLGAGEEHKKTEPAKSKQGAGRMPRSWPVLLWAPNVIGYVRIVLTFVGYHYAMHDWRLTVGTYVISQA